MAAVVLLISDMSVATSCESNERLCSMRKNGVVSGLPGALYSICCLGASTILESEKIVTMWPTND